jgi:vacuolar iron transporter family protein
LTAPNSSKHRVLKPARHGERHRQERVGWLRAAVLGANDGIVSTASLVVGVASARASAQDVLIAGVAGMVAGAMSMAAGEYVSVSSQRDTEQADLEIERRELAHDSAFELEELTAIYQSRGLTRELAERVASQLMAHDALGAHARDELGILDHTSAKPLQAAFASCATFSLGAIVPLLSVALAPSGYTVPWVAFSALLGLATLGVISARAGGAPVLVATLRVMFWGAIAMAVTAGVGVVFGVNA